MLVNKCNKININITKDIDPKFIPLYKMCEASDGPKISLQNKSQGIEIHSLTPQLFQQWRQLWRPPRGSQLEHEYFHGLSGVHL
jgi:hypothetical protein